MMENFIDIIKSEYNEKTTEIHKNSKLYYKFLVNDVNKTTKMFWNLEDLK